MAETAAIQAGERLAPRRRLRTLRKLARHRSFVIGGAIVLVLVIAALAAPLLTAFDPTTMRVRLRFKPPQWDFPFGTDRFGRDIYTRVLYGAQISLWIGLATTLLSGAIGAAVGVISAQFRALDAPLHLDEGVARLSHFARAVRPDRCTNASAERGRSSCTCCQRRHFFQKKNFRGRRMEKKKKDG
jgi:ABC-type Fe3+ transport system permease subunit